MAHEPKKRHSKAAKRTRRASIILKGVNLLVCKNCQSKILSHTVCKNCGFYSGQKTVESKAQVKVVKA